MPSVTTTYSPASTRACSMNFAYRLRPARILPSIFAAMPWCTMMSPSASRRHLPTLP